LLHLLQPSRALLVAQSGRAGSGAPLSRRLLPGSALRLLGLSTALQQLRLRSKAAAAAAAAAAAVVVTAAVAFVAADEAVFLLPLRPFPCPFPRFSICFCSWQG